MCGQAGGDLRLEFLALAPTAFHHLGRHAHGDGAAAEVWVTSLLLFNNLLPISLYVTLEPCVMCAGALVNARIGRVVYGATDPKAGAMESLYHVCADERLNHRPPVTAGVLRLTRGTSTDTITIDTISGTVPYSFETVDTVDGEPVAVLTAGTDMVEVPIRFTESRCDPHALAEVKQALYAARPVLRAEAC